MMAPGRREAAVVDRAPATGTLHSRSTFIAIDFHNVMSR
jgi:hypothetical protein